MLLPLQKRKKKSNCILNFISSIGTNCWFADIEKSLSSSIHFFFQDKRWVESYSFHFTKRIQNNLFSNGFQFLENMAICNFNFFSIFIFALQKKKEKLNKCNNNKEGKAISTIIHLQKECQSRASIFNNMLFNLFFFSLSFLFYYSLSSNTLNSNQNKNNNNWKCLKWFVHTTNYYVSPLQNYTKRNKKLEKIRLKRE